MLTTVTAMEGATAMEGVMAMEGATVMDGATVTAMATVAMDELAQQRWTARRQLDGKGQHDC